MYFLIFEPGYMLKLCLNSNESQPIYAYKRYAYKKECILTDNHPIPLSKEIDLP